MKVNIATGNESFEAWRERDHDDIVLALGLAVWFAERGPRPAGVPVIVGGSGRRTFVMPDPFNGGGRWGI